MNDAMTTAKVVTTPKKRPAKKNQELTLSYRLMVLYRFVLAIVGGYFLAMMAARAIAKFFTSNPFTAAMSATLWAFAIYAAVFIWVFMVNKTLKATLGVLIPALLLTIYVKVGL
ncbi:hypothetical protein BFG52_04045 [Acinetobacter larvae]|uniref:Iron transporter n=2 Tax=Acinetobacter larvae TaxID=1789224 RepID=A0A1B2M490_9GAMM|nr:hypothetical protein BFG52_04045 [Acinetobacter larvae]